MCTDMQPEADMETHQLLVADKLTVGELMTTNILALPPLAPVRQVTSPCLDMLTAVSVTSLAIALRGR